MIGPAEEVRKTYSAVYLEMLFLLGGYCDSEPTMEDCRAMARARVAGVQQTLEAIYAARRGQLSAEKERSLSSPPTALPLFDREEKED